MSLNIDLLRTLCQLPGAPGYEQAIRSKVQEEIKGLVDEVRIDNMGNLIALKHGRNRDQSVMVAAHLDEISFIVTHVDKDGYAHFHTMGGFDPKTLTAQRVLVHGKKTLMGVMGSKPIHIMSPEDRNKAPKLKDYFIDFGLPYEEVIKYIQIGDVVTRERDLIELGECVSSKSLDNRISVFVLIEALKRMEQPAYDFYAVFTVQEEVGLRGATVATRAIDPTYGFGLDTTIANDTPQAKPQEMVTSLGKGAAIKVMDGSVITDYRMLRYMESVAEGLKLPYQREILPRGGTDTGAVQRGGSGSIAGCVSIPTRHIHSVVEMCHKEDIEGAIQLLSACLEQLDRFDHNW
ncbi:MAG: M42 family metallopeptidase [Bacteroidia bacterium]